MAIQTIKGIDTLAGPDFYDTSTTPLFPAGETRYGQKDSVWIYVQAASAIAQYDVVSITTAGAAAPLTKANADLQLPVGAAQVAIASASYGWVCTQSPLGGVGINVLANCAAGVQLYTSATAGSLDDTATDQTAVNAVALVAARGGTNGSAEAILTFPHTL